MQFRRSSTEGSARQEAAGGDRISLVRVVQALIALWLLASPALYTGAPVLVVGKDVLAGGLLLTVTVAAAAARSGRLRRTETGVCLGLGALLIVASFVIDHTTDTGSLASQWNELLVGVLLVCLGANRAR